MYDQEVKLSVSDIIKGRYVGLVGLDRKVRFQALAKVIALCPWGRHFIPVIYLYNNSSYSRILTGCRLRSIRGQTHDWRYHDKVLRI